MLNYLAILISVLSISGNILVILAWIVDKRIRNPSNAYLLALAIVDLIIGSFVVPIGSHYLHMEKWTLGIPMCKIWLMSCYGLSIVSSMLLVYIAVDRYRVLFEGVSYVQRRRYSSVILCFVATYLIGFWVASPILLDFENVMYDPSATKVCVARKTVTWTMLTNLPNSIIPLCLLCWLYGNIFMELRRRFAKHANLQQQGECTSTSNCGEGYGGMDSIPSPISRISGNSDAEEKLTSKKILYLQKERRAALTLGLLIILFAICWLPYVIVTTAGALQLAKPSKLTYVICAIVGWINCCVNPLVYAIRNRDFRLALNKLFGFK